MYFAFEESPNQIMRNMRSIGLNFDEYIKKGLLEFHSFRPGLYGLEMHLANMYKLIKKFKPKAVILDPITNLVSAGLLNEVNSMLLRLVDHLQSEGVTLMLTALNSGATEHIDENVSSLVDVWLLVRDVESNGERNRALYIMKSRGMKHSKEVREFVISSSGLSLVDVYRGTDGVLIGSARIAKEKELIANAGKNGRSNFKSISKRNK